VYLILIFRVCLLFAFLIAALKLGEWKNWQRYYPTVLFVIVANQFASYLSYHHSLWYYNPDIFVKTSTTVELFNSFVMLPAATFLYLSRFPTSNKLNQCGYIVLWVCIFGSLEFIDHYIVKGISYNNGWSYFASLTIDFAIFINIYLHYLKPLWGWGANLVVAFLVFILFNFIGGEFK